MRLIFVRTLIVASSLSSGFSDASPYSLPTVFVSASCAWSRELRGQVSDGDFLHCMVPAFASCPSRMLGSQRASCVCNMQQGRFMSAWLCHPAARIQNRIRRSPRSMEIHQRMPPSHAWTLVSADLVVRALSPNPEQQHQHQHRQSLPVSRALPVQVQNFFVTTLSGAKSNA